MRSWACWQVPPCIPGFRSRAAPASWSPTPSRSSGAPDEKGAQREPDGPARRPRRLRGRLRGDPLHLGPQEGRAAGGRRPRPRRRRRQRPRLPTGDPSASASTPSPSAGASASGTAPAVPETDTVTPPAGDATADGLLPSKGLPENVLVAFAETRRSRFSSSIRRASPTSSSSSSPTRCARATTSRSSSSTSRTSPSTRVSPPASRSAGPRRWSWSGPGS